MEDVEAMDFKFLCHDCHRTFLYKKARTPTANILMNMRDRRWNWLGHMLRMDEDRLVRKVLLDFVKPEKE